MAVHQHKPALANQRAFLRGVGVAVALPWLESIPVWGGESKTSSSPESFPRRFAALFMGNGINSKHWWAKGSGAGMELGTSLEPMEPLKRKMNFIDGLFNKNATGVDAMEEGDGTVLDNSCLLLGGTLETGRVLDYSKESDDGRKLCSLYLSIMDRMGVRLDRFGDAELRLARL